MDMGLVWIAVSSIIGASIAVLDQHLPKVWQQSKLWHQWHNNQMKQAI